MTTSRVILGALVAALVGVVVLVVGFTGRGPAPQLGDSVHVVPTPLVTAPPSPGGTSTTAGAGVVSPTPPAAGDDDDDGVDDDTDSSDDPDTD